MLSHYPFSAMVSFRLIEEAATHGEEWSLLLYVTVLDAAPVF